MPSNPIGKNTKNVPVNMPKSLPKELKAAAISLGISRNRLIVEYLQLGLADGSILLAPERWAKIQRERAED